MTASIRTEAVLLAAGRGSRLGHGGGAPKALLPIGPRSLEDPTETCFLRRQIEQLHACDVQRVAVVVGWRREVMKAALASWDLGAQVVVNPTPEFEPSGSLHSFQLAIRAGMGILDGTRQTLLMDADIVYDRRVLERLLAAPDRSALLVCATHDATSEEVLVWGDSERPRFLGKGLAPDLVGGAPCLGEAVGIVKIAPADHAIARRITDWMLGDPDAPEGELRRRGFGPARRATEHEELTGRLMQLERMACVTFGAELVFMEVDTPEEHERLRRDVYPRLLAEEGRRYRGARGDSPAPDVNNSG